MNLKKCIAILLFLIPISVSAQNTRQNNLVYNYFNNYGGDILQDAAHPACTWSYVTVQPGYNYTYYLTVYYKQVLTSRTFSCEYRLKLSSIGKFISITSTRCGCSDCNCFGVCRWVDFEDITSEYNRIRYERYVGKSLFWMSCEEYTNVSLYFDWEDRGYYTLY